MDQTASLLVYISIHAPREGSDLGQYYLVPFNDNFNPRSP